MKRAAVFALLLVLALLSASACAAPAVTPTPVPTAAAASTPEPTPEPTREPVELFVSAAASLTDVLVEIAKGYKTVSPHVTLTFNFDSSGTLQTQIEEGAPADIFFSAAQKQMTAMKEKGFTADDTIKNILVNKVVLIIPANSDKGITSFEDVATGKVRLVAVGEASVPVGQYTEEIYTTLGTWDAVKAKANFGTNVRNVLAWVESGDVDCGIVYATDAATTDLVKVVAEAPEGSHKPVVYPAAVLTNATHPDEAKAFLDYLSGPEASAAFEAAGFAIYND